MSRPPLDPLQARIHEARKPPLPPVYPARPFKPADLATAPAKGEVVAKEPGALQEEIGELPADFSTEPDALEQEVQISEPGTLRKEELIHLREEEDGSPACPFNINWIPEDRENLRRFLTEQFVPLSRERDRRSTRRAVHRTFRGGSVVFSFFPFLRSRAVKKPSTNADSDVHAKLVGEYWRFSTSAGGYKGLDWDDREAEFIRAIERMR
jgi:hypothetical protein